MEVLKISVSLACRHEVSKWDVFMAHLDWLLTESGSVLILQEPESYYDIYLVCLVSLLKKSIEGLVMQESCSCF